jgi:beta-lactamase regulating signal transducer with metallopeptidase domain
MIATIPNALLLLHILTMAALKAAVVLALASILTSCMRHFSAAARHLVWTLTLAVAFLLPIVAALTPAWRLALLPASATTTSAVDSPSQAFVLSPSTEHGPHVGQSSQHIQPEPHEATPVNAISPATIITPQTPAVVALPTPAHHYHLASWILFAWFVGAALVAIGWIAGVTAASRLAAFAMPVRSGPLFEAVDAIQAELGIQRGINVRVGGSVAMPMTFGLFRPILLLPNEALVWSSNKIRSVLLHELAHVKRHDCATQLLSQGVCAIYWFNPLAWLAAARLRAERERACDDVVLREGAEPTGYAQLLLSLAVKGQQRFGYPVTAAMARRSGLRQRVLCILDPEVHRQSVNPWAARSLVLLVAMLLIPLASVRIGSRSAHAQASPPATQPLVATSQPITAADLIRKIRQDEGWIDSVKSFRVRLQDTWTHPDKKPGESGMLELGFDQQRLYEAYEMPVDARVSVWDGTRAWGYERDHRLLELGTINGKPITGKDFYYLRGSMGEPMMLSELAYFRAGMRRPWWRKGMREGPGEAISFGLPPDFHITGETTFRGKKCYEVSRDLRMDVFYVGIDDQHLYGIEELEWPLVKDSQNQWVWAKDPRDGGVLKQFGKEVGQTFQDFEQAYKWIDGLPADQRKPMHARISVLRRPLARPSTLFWYEDYKELGPGYWFPMLQGYDLWDTRPGKLGDPPESSRAEKVLEISVDQPLPEQWFVQDWKEGVPVQDSSHKPYLMYFYKKHFTTQEWQTVLDEGNKREADRQAEVDRTEPVVGKPAPELPE